MENDAGDRVDHCGEGGDRKYVARDFDGAFFGGALDFLDVLGIRIGADAPNISEDGAGIGDENCREFAVVIPGAGDGLFVDILGGLVEIKINGGNVSLHAIHADVALTLLFGVVERVCVEKRPDELAADVFEAEFERGVLEDGMVSAIECGGADVEALLVGDFFRSDEMVGVAGAGGGDGGIERMVEKVAQGNARQGGFNGFGGGSAIEHARLCGHDGRLFYTVVEQRHRREKRWSKRFSRRESWQNWNLLFCGARLCGSVSVFLREAFDAASGIDKFLLAGEERVAVGANFDAQHVALDGGAGGKRMTASTVYGDRVVVGVNSGFHDSPF